MTWSNPAFPVGTTYWLRIAWSASGDPVNRPVLSPPSFWSVALRASAAAFQASRVVSSSAHAHAAAGFLAPWGTTNAWPDVTENGLPSLSLNGTAPSWTLSRYGDSTFGYHWASTCAPTWSVTNWLASPNVSNASVKLLTFANPPWASVIFLSRSSPAVFAGSSSVGRPWSSVSLPPMARTQSPA